MKMGIKNRQKPKTLFVNINPRPGWTMDKTMIEFPLGLCYVASETKRAGFDFDILDLKLEDKTNQQVADITAEGDYDVVALGGMSHAYFVIKPLVKAIKKRVPNIIIVVGGTVTTAMPEKFLKWTAADVAVMGEGEYIFVEILKRLEQGQKLNGVMGIAFKQENRIIKEEPASPILNLEDGTKVWHF